ncbi:dUTP diphosphatase (plasmid) [Microbulbifer sp. ANSA001]|uniref:dUTP diphosphatase n=1 Tax=Microbulbifer sp. ANSA001 TaxID=3243358 RepID=UPI0040420847
MHQQLKGMLERQAAFNESVKPNWSIRDMDWATAILTETSELLDHLGWKWWANQKRDLPQAQLEAVDVSCFLFSWILQEEDCDIERATEVLVSGLSKDMGGFPAPVRAAKTFVSNVLTMENPSVSLPLFRSLLDQLGLTVATLADLHLGKMVLNRFRQDRGYADGSYIKVWDGLEDNELLHKTVLGLERFRAAHPEYADASDEQVIYSGLQEAYSVFQQSQKGVGEIEVLR